MRLFIISLFFFFPQHVYASSLSEINSQYGEHLFETVMQDTDEREKSGFILGYANRLLFLNVTSSADKFLSYFESHFPDETFPKQYISYLLRKYPISEIKNSMPFVTEEPYFALKILLKEQNDTGISPKEEIQKFIDIPQKIGTEVAESFYFLAKEKKYAQAVAVYNNILSGYYYDYGEREKREMYPKRILSVLAYSNKFIEGYAAYYVGNKEEARDLLYQATLDTSLPDFVQREYAALYVRVLDETGNTERLLSEISNLEERFPSDYRFPLFHALSLFQKDRIDEGRSKYSEALKKHFQFALPYGGLFDDYYPGSRYVNYALFHNVYFQAFASKYLSDLSGEPLENKLAVYLSMAYGYELLNMHTQAYVFKEEANYTYTHSQILNQVSTEKMTDISMGFSLLNYHMRLNSETKRGSADIYTALMDGAAKTIYGVDKYYNAEQTVENLERFSHQEQENDLLLFTENYLQWQLAEDQPHNFSAPAQSTVQLLNKYPLAVFLYYRMNEIDPNFISQDELERKKDILLESMDILDVDNIRILGTNDKEMREKISSTYPKNVLGFLKLVTYAPDLLKENTYRTMLHDFNQFQLQYDLNDLEDTEMLLNFSASSSQEQQQILYKVFADKSKIPVLGRGRILFYGLGVFDKFYDDHQRSSFNRAEVLKMMYVLHGKAPLIKQEMDSFIQDKSHWTYMYFKDVPIDAWYAPYVFAAKKDGIVQGYKDGTFRPDKPVTRAEVIKILLQSFSNNNFHAQNTGNWMEPYMNFINNQNDDYSYLLDTYTLASIKENVSYEDILSIFTWFYIHFRDVNA